MARMDKMTNHQASRLRPGELVRRKLPLDDPTGQGSRVVYVVERVALKAHRNDDVTIYAGNQIFKAWEIERVRDDRGE
jgi:hypothetical protein